MVQHPRDPVRSVPGIRLSARCTPTTSCPASTARAAATAESTPPLIAANTRMDSSVRAALPAALGACRPSWVPLAALGARRPHRMPAGCTGCPRWHWLPAGRAPSLALPRVHPARAHHARSNLGSVRESPPFGNSGFGKRRDRVTRSTATPHRSIPEFPNSVAEDQRRQCLVWRWPTRPLELGPPEMAMVRPHPVACTTPFGNSGIELAQDRVTRCTRPRHRRSPEFSNTAAGEFGAGRSPRRPIAWHAG